MTQWSSVQSNLLCWDFWEEWAVQCLAYVKWQGCRHQAYKLQTETNKTLQYWLSTILSTVYLQPVYTPYLPQYLPQWSLAPCTEQQQFAALFMGLTAAYNRMIKMMSMKSGRYPFQTCIQHNAGLWTEQNHRRSPSLIEQRLILF